MEENKEIAALQNLMDDPDEEVFGLVSDRIFNMGSGIIPTLEHWWETCPDQQVQVRIEGLIHRLHFQDLVHEFKNWKNSTKPELLTGALLAARFQFPELAVPPLLAEVEKLRRNVWLELNNYLTPLEQIHVLHSILFSYFGLKGQPKDFTKPDEFLINHVLTTKKGNTIGIGLLYLILCEQLDIPVRAIHIPGQFVLAYFKQDDDLNDTKTEESRIEYFIEPASGQVFTLRDVDAYFQRMKLILDIEYLKPQDNVHSLAHVLGELSQCYTTENTLNKKEELMELVKLLTS